jgi:uncharacterized protein (TIGR00661 family)
MKILYGIQSTGNGHITRSSKLVQKLAVSGCFVDVIFSGNNSQIKFPFPIKHNFSGLTLQYEDNGKVDYWETYKNLKLMKFIKDISLDISSYDLVITDFEPITAWAAKLQDKLSIGIGNQYSFLSENTPRPNKRDGFSEFILKWMAPVKKPIGLHFENYDDFIKPPILRDSLYRMDSINKGHYVVYLANWNIDILINTLYKIDCKFEVFSKVKKPYRFKNCFVKPIEKENFDLSLQTCEGVITAGGFQTSAESLFLNKKLMVIPISNQYEQICNAESLKRLGVKVGGLEDINDFLYYEGYQKKVIWSDPTNEIVKSILDLRIK